MLSFILSCKQDMTQYKAYQMDEPMNSRSHSTHTALNHSEFISYTWVPQSTIIRAPNVQESYGTRARLKSKLANLPVEFSKEVFQI